MVTIGAGGGFPTGGDLTSTSGIPDSAALSSVRLLLPEDGGLRRHAMPAASAGPFGIR